jgi:hypothetical protein
MWHIDQLQGNDRETNNETMAIARQGRSKYATIMGPLLGSSPQAKTMEILLEAVCST